ncbi:MAG: preprotein translocase subunit TatC [Rhizobiaceae bacterium]|nr:preprotein translocase subunit TatC [Rhizobiaceae bacterium]
MTLIEARPAVKRESMHPSITAEQISQLVEQFYAQVQTNPRLAPLFSQNMSSDWGPHLEKMKGFWRSVLLKSGEYKGRPVPVHLQITDIRSEDFEEWLQLFSSVSERIFTCEAADVVNQAARRIATSLWLSRTSDPFASPPAWSQPVSAQNHPSAP